MAGFKITVGLDDTQITRDAKEAAAETAEAFDDADIGGVITKSARKGFESISQGAKTMATNAAKEMDSLTRKGVFSRLHDQARSAFNNIASAARTTFSAVGNVIQNALGVAGGNLITSGLSRLTGMLSDLGKTGFDTNERLENLTEALKAVTGDAALAAKQIEQIEKLAKQTPFEFPDLANAALLMQSFGFSAQEVEDHLKAVADAGARAGLTMSGGVKEGLNAVVVVLGQIAGRANLSTQDLLQLSTKALPVFDILKAKAASLGKDFQKELEAGRISGPATARFLLDEFGRIPGSLDFALSQSKTFTGKMSNLTDNLKKRAADATKDAFESMKLTLDKVSLFLEGDGGEKLAKALAPKLAAPIDFINRALDAVQKGTIKEFLVEEAKAAVVEMFNILKDGFNAIKQPLIDFLKTSVIDPIVAGIGNAVSAAFEKIKEELKKQVPSTDDLKKLTTPPAPGVPSPLEQIFRYGFRGGIISGDPAGGLVPQNIVYQQGRKKVVTGKPGTGEPQLENIFKLPTVPPGPPVVAITTVRALQDFVRINDTQIPPAGQTPIGFIERDFELKAQAIALEEANKDLIRSLGGITVATEATTEATKAGTKSTKDWGAAMFTTGEVVKQVFDFGLRQTFEGMFSSVITGAVKLKDGVLGAIAQIRSRVGDFLAQGVGNLLFGGPAGGTGGTGGGGGFWGSLFGGGGAAGGVGGTGGGGVSGAVGSAVSGGLWGSIKRALGFGGGGGWALTSGLSGPTLQAAGSSGVFGGLAGGASAAGPALAGAAGGGFFGGTGGFLGGLAAAGPLIGFAAGTALGGKSFAGQLIGGAGGALAGAGLGLLGYSALGGTLATTGFAGAAAAFLTNPFTIAIGGALLIGAYFLGKQKQRKQDEQQADAIWVNEREQTRAIIAAVNSDRMDGSEAISAHAQLRAQTIAQLNQIKTKSVRESRLTNQLRDLDNSIVRELQDAVARQAKRKGIIPRLTPEFAAGGVVPGIDRGTDSVLIKARPGEIVLNQAQQARLAGIAGGGIFQRLGLPAGSQTGGYQGGGFISSTGPGPDISISLVLESEGEQIGKLVAKGLRTSTGSRATVRVMDSARRNGEF